MRNLLNKCNHSLKNLGLGSQSALSQYKRLRFRSKAALRKCFNDDEKQILSCRNNKRFYSFVNKKLRPSSCVSSLKLDSGELISDENEIASIFSTEFQKNYASNSNHTFLHSFAMRSSAICEDPIFDHASILAALRQTSNSAEGPEHLPGRFFRMLINSAKLAPSLAIIYQQSFLTGRIPDMWRFAKVHPIFKKGRRDIIRSTIYDYLIDNDLFCHAQHGFHNKRSTVSSLLISQHEYINCIEDKCDVDVVLFDFAKAIDAVSHQLLLIKLSACGLSENMLSWIANFLCDRRQYVCIGAKSSSVMCVSCGVVQGSVIGLLLFVLFNNDLADVVRSVSILLYADDLMLFRAISCLNDRFVLQSAINDVTLRSKTWMLPLSLEKLAYLHIGSRFDNHTYNYDSCIIKQACCVKDLGVIFCDTLVFREHINNICKKSMRFML